MRSKARDEVHDFLKSVVPTISEVRRVPGYPQYSLSDCGILFRIQHSLAAAKEECLSTFGDLSELKYSFCAEWFYDKQGYPVAYLHRGKRRTRHPKKIYRLMAATYLGPSPPDAKLVRHLDGNSRNNHVSNLVWGTHAENMEDLRKHREARTPLTKELQQEIAAYLLLKSGYSVGVKEQAAEKFNVAFSTVCRIWEKTKY